MTLTVELPEEVAVVLRRIPTKERNEYAAAVIREAVQSEITEQSEKHLQTEAERADFEESCLAISESVSQIETDETFSLEECIARSQERRTLRLAAREKAVAENRSL